MLIHYFLFPIPLVENITQLNYNYMIKQFLVTPESKLPIISLICWLLYSPPSPKRNLWNLCIHVYRHYEKTLCLPSVPGSFMIFLSFFNSSFGFKTTLDHPQDLAWSMKLTVQVNCSQGKHRGREQVLGRKCSKEQSPVELNKKMKEGNI